MILDSQTNKVYFSAHTFRDHPRVTRRVMDALLENGIPFGLLEHTNDGWCRDYMPIQVAEDRYISYRYFPDYLNDEKDRSRVTNPRKQLEALGIEPVETDIIMDGGNVIKCADHVIMTEKVFWENRETYSQAKLVAELERLFQCELIFLPWDRHEKYGHADGIVRYAGGQTVLMTNYVDFDPRMAEIFQERLARAFDVKVLAYDAKRVHPYSWAYINFLQTARAILVPAFGIAEDAQALRQIALCFPEYKGRVHPIRVNSYVKEGGALNCVTWNILDPQATEGEWGKIERQIQEKGLKTMTGASLDEWMDIVDGRLTPEEEVLFAENGEKLKAYGLECVRKRMESDNQT